MYDFVLIQGTWPQLNAQLKSAMDTINANKKKKIVSVSHNSSDVLGVINYSALIIIYTEK